MVQWCQRIGFLGIRVLAEEEKSKSMLAGSSEQRTGVQFLEVRRLRKSEMK